jgi:RimJ/RimL family protein N-acetyltransferase
VLTGKKVVLRPIRRSDIANFLKWFNDPEVIQYIDLYLPMTEMVEEKWIEDLENNLNKVRLVIEAIQDDSGQPIGSIGFQAINQRDQTAEFGIALGEKEYWSKGFGTEAAQLLMNYGFQQLNLHRISSSAFAFNERSIKLHKKVGFKEEGRHRKEIFKNGQFHDRVMFGILREEWAEATSK